jgi:hypothetical protein
MLGIQAYVEKLKLAVEIRQYCQLIAVANTALPRTANGDWYVAI